MSDDSLARNASGSSATAEADYDAIYATIVATERGRWFLDEHVRRYRGVDTALVLAGIARIEEAIRGAGVPEPPPAVQNELVAMLETVWQARREVIGRNGDPAAIGEAAVADFRYAAEQIQELALAARNGDPDPDPGGQLAFQLNRLVGAGDRLERSVAALRVMLGLLDQLEHRLHRLADAGPVDTAEAAQWPEAMPTAPAWPLPDAEAGSDLVAAPIPEQPAEPDLPPPQSEIGYTEALWEVAAPEPEPAQNEIARSDDPASEAMVADWAFELDRTEGQPFASVSPSAPEAAPGLSALERLEAREYARQRLTSAPVPEPLKPVEEDGFQVPAPANLRDWGSFDDLVIGSPPAESAKPASPLDTVPADWTVAPADVIQPVEPIFDADLFDAGHPPDPPATRVQTAAEQGVASPSSRSWETYASTRFPDSMPAPAPFVSGEALSAPDAPASISLREPPASTPMPEPSDVLKQSSPRAPSDEVPSVIDRLENMRSAIAALMDEVSEKTASRIPPPPLRS